LLPVMKLRLAEPAHLIDISRLGDAGLRGVREEGGGLRIGALTTHREVERDPVLRERCPLLAQVAGRVGDRQVRTRGTIGGALAHADAAADYPAAILALDAELVARGPGGERVIPAADFFVAFLTTALAADEILTEIRLPALPPRTGAEYQKLANQASGYALVGIAAVVSLDEAGRYAAVRVGITGASETARRAGATEAALRGATLERRRSRPPPSGRRRAWTRWTTCTLPADYRLAVTKGLTRRALLAATERARGA
jgi:carbon-monoxide dehydrogenase medium subunit